MIQLNSMAVRERSLSMVGNAMFTAEIRKVPMNEVAATTSSIKSSALFPILLLILLLLCECWLAAAFWVIFFSLCVCG